MITRKQEAAIQNWLFQNKAIVVIGPRQVGKTTLVRKLTDELKRPILWLTGDSPEVRSQLKDISLSTLKLLIGDHKVVVVDEAQRLHNAGLTLKLVTDHFPNIQLFVTGSSSLDIAAEIKESLVGRKIEFPLYPLSFGEMVGHHGYLAELGLLESRMIYGYYPNVVNSSINQAITLLNDLADGLMYKDILSMDQVKKPSLLVKLLQALALQLGGEVSYNEVAQLIGADPLTVERYIDLLEQSYIIFRLPALSRNARNEIKKGRKIYFYDNGIRNAIIQNFSPLDLRQDTGALWENFLIVERMKRNKYDSHFCNTFFWRTTSQQEIDYIEDSSGRLDAFEFKWGGAKQKKFPNSFKEAYPNSNTLIVDRNNFMEFLGIV